MAGYNDLTIYDNSMINNYLNRLSYPKCFYVTFGILTGIILGIMFLGSLISLNIAGIIISILQIP